MHIVSIVLSALTFFGIVAHGGGASAQSARDLVGTWTLVSVTLERGDKKTEPFGPAPKGLAIFDGTRQSIMIFRVDMPKFASNNRTMGTPEENKAVVQGSLAFFGPYTFDEANRSMSIRVEGSNYPNWFGLELKRSIVLTGNQLTISNPVPSDGVSSGVVSIVWKRAN